MYASAPATGAASQRASKNKRTARRIEPDRRAEEAPKQRNIRGGAVRELDFPQAESGAAKTAKHVGTDASAPNVTDRRRARPVSAPRSRAPPCPLTDEAGCRPLVMDMEELLQRSQAAPDRFRVRDEIAEKSQDATPVVVQARRPTSHSPVRVASEVQKAAQRHKRHGRCRIGEDLGDRPARQPAPPDDAVFAKERERAMHRPADDVARYSEAAAVRAGGIGRKETAAMGGR